MRNARARHGVEIAAVPGTGIDGRVTKSDILGYIASGAHQAAAVARSGAYHHTSKPRSSRVQRSVTPSNVVAG